MQCQWSNLQLSTFSAAKDALKSSTLLVQYDVSKPITLAYDGSTYEVGAMLSY